MAVVVDLDAARHARQAESVGQRLEQLLLRRGVGELPPQRLARVDQRVRHQLLLLAALGDGDFDLAAAFDAQRFCQQMALRNVVRQQDQRGTRLVVVELREERAQHLARTERPVGLREIGAVAPVLSGAEEEHLDAAEAALLMDGEHVGLLGAARIDALRRLRRRQRGEPVAVDRGALEIERGRGFLHLARKLVAHRLALAGQEGVGLPHQLGVFGEIDLLGAGRRAALDLMQQAWPRAAFEKSVRAGAQQERALQRRDGAVDRPHRGERPVIAAPARARAAVLEDLRRPVIRGDDDVGKRLVVAQQHVEPRPQTLDQVGFEQQRFRLGRSGDELHGGGRRDHPFDAGVVPGRAGIGRDRAS